jgi:hypothetical protein
MPELLGSQEWITRCSVNVSTLSRGDVPNSELHFTAVDQRTLS